MSLTVSIYIRFYSVITGHPRKEMKRNEIKKQSGGKKKKDKRERRMEGEEER